MKMNLSKRDKKLLLYVGGILLLVLVYFLFFRNMQESNQAIEREIATLEQEYDRLRLLSEKAGEYTVETERMNNEIANIILKFPPDMREEDAIVYAHTLETLSEMHISNISIDSKQLMYSTQAGPAMHLYDMPIEYRFTVGYDSFKKVAELIMNNADKRNMESLTLSFDNGTGKLVGTAELNMYYLLGTDGKYESPVVRPMPQGLDDLFGTVEGDAPADTGEEDTVEADTEGEVSDDSANEDTEAGNTDNKDTDSKKAR